jgi:hypothetical protein
MIDEKMAYNFTAFKKWAESEGISMDDEDDWGNWWTCWKAGYLQSMND